MDKTVVIRCFDACYYTLFYPAFFLGKPKATIQKLFKWLFAYAWYAENEATIDFLDRELPLLPEIVEAKGKEWIADAEKTLQSRTRYYDLDYLDPDMSKMPAAWDKDKKRHERDKRKSHNAENLRRVKEAKAAVEYTKK